MCTQLFLTKSSHTVIQPLIRSSTWPPVNHDMTVLIRSIPMPRLRLPPVIPLPPRCPQPHIIYTLTGAGVATYQHAHTHSACILYMSMAKNINLNTIVSITK